jgi:hypothetical protein
MLEGGLSLGDLLMDPCLAGNIEDLESLVNSPEPCDGEIARRCCELSRTVLFRISPLEDHVTVKKIADLFWQACEKIAHAEKLGHREHRLLSEYRKHVQLRAEMLRDTLSSA